MSLIVKNAVREFAKTNNVNTSGDVFAKLDERVRKMLSDAISRTKANGRKTLKARDL